MFYDKEEEVQVIESLDGSQVWVEKHEGTLYLSSRDPNGQETSEAFAPEEALALARELTWLAGGYPEPHVWAAYASIRTPQGRSIYHELSLHATKAGAEQEVEKQKRENPSFTFGVRRQKIGA